MVVDEIPVFDALDVKGIDQYLFIIKKYIVDQWRLRIILLVLDAGYLVQQELPLDLSLIKEQQHEVATIVVSHGEQLLVWTDGYLFGFDVFSFDVDPVADYLIFNVPYQDRISLERILW